MSLSVVGRSRCGRGDIAEGYLLPGNGCASSPVIAMGELAAVDRRRVRIVSRQSAIAPTSVTAMGM